MWNVWNVNEVRSGVAAFDREMLPAELGGGTPPAGDGPDRTVGP